jgi:hypothetical protein
MLKYSVLFLVLIFNSTAMAQRSSPTEFVSGDGFVFASFGRSVDFALDVSQIDPNAPSGSMVADFFSFPGNHVMTMESTSINSVEVVRKLGLIAGTARFIDVFTGEESLADFSVVFEDVSSRRRNDTMMLTLFLPSGTETFTGELLSGDVEVGKRKR